MQTALAKITGGSSHEKQPALSHSDNGGDSDGDVACGDRESEVHGIEFDALDKLNDI